MLLQVSGFVTALRLFFVYGLTSRPQFTFPAVGHKEVSPNLPSEEPKKIDHTPYRPPHLRKKDRLNIKQSKPQDHRIFSDDDSFTMNFMSSDSDYSDSDGSIKDTDSVQSSKVRVAALVCLQVTSQHQCFVLWPTFLCSGNLFYPDIIIARLFLNVKIQVSILVALPVVLILLLIHIFSFSWWRIFVELTQNHLLPNGQFFCRLMMC